jgi:Ca2+-binding EF-hand superfamily protein
MDRASAATLISMFDNSGMGKIIFGDFPNLHKFISDHTMIFNQHDMDRDGILIVAEVQAALVRLGFALDDAVFRTVLQRFDPELKGRFTFPQFMEVSIFLGNLRRLFGFYDKEQEGKITLDMSTFCMAAVNIVGNKSVRKSKKEGREGKKHHSKGK